MRKLTWYFVVALATALICLLLTGPVHSTEPSSRVVAALAVTFGKAKAPCVCTSPADCACGEKCHCDNCAGKNIEPVKRGCTCGCEQTGKCVCKNCDTGNKGAYPSCICGCVTTGSCTCRDCNHPQATPLAAKRESVVPHVGMRYQHPDNGRWYTYQADGYWHVDSRPVQYNPQLNYRPVQVIDSFGIDNCGPSG